MFEDFIKCSVVLCLWGAGCSQGGVNLGAMGESERLSLSESSLCRDSTTYDGTLFIRADELEAVEGCEVFTGGLEIDMVDFYDLSALHALREVQGQLAVYARGADPSQSSLGRLASLEGLESLERAEALLLSGVESVDLQPLSNLRGELQSVLITGWPNLTSMHGLERVTGVRRLIVNGNPQLDSLQGLSLGDSMESLSVSGDRLARLGIPIPSNVDYISLSGSLLTDCDDFAGLERALAIRLVDSPRLADFSGLSGLQSVDEISLVNLPQMEQLPGFDNLRAVNELMVRDNANLRTWVGFPNLQRNPSPEDERYAEDFEHIPYLSGPDLVVVERNPLLQEVTLPEQWRSVEYLRFADNESLQRVAAAQLDEVEVLVIQDHLNLREVALGALQTVNRLEVLNNPQLTLGVFDPVQTFEREVSGNATP